MKRKKVLGNDVLKLVCAVLLFFVVTVLTPTSTIVADAASTELKLVEVSRPTDVSTMISKNLGLIVTQPAKSDPEYYNFTVTERGWLIIDFDNQNPISNFFKIFTNSYMTARIDYLEEQTITRYYEYRYYYYLEPGTYYVKSQGMSNNDLHYFGFFLPNSSIISHKLVKSNDGSSYTDTVSFTPKMGKTYLVPTIVEPSKVVDTQYNNAWKDAITNANDVYTITNNGEYTVRATFTDAEWKYCPAMYSFSVYDIVKPQEDAGNGSENPGEASGNTDIKPISTVNETPQDDAAPISLATPSGLKVSKEHTSITVKWKKVSDIDGYEIQYSTSKNFSSVKTKTYKASKKSAKINKLKANKKYYVRIRSFKTIDSKKIYSDWSNTKKVKTSK